MREREFNLAFPLCVVSALVLGSACQDPPSFVEHTANQNGAADTASGGADATAASGIAAPGTDVAGAGEGQSGPKVITKKFSAAESENVTLNYPWGGDTASQPITMSYDTMSTTSDIKAPGVPMHTDLFTQAASDGKASETFTQAPSSGVLDIVLVVDNSGSMAAHQQNLSTRLAPLLQYISDSQWRINVVTTDPRDGCMRALIQKDDPNVDEAFAQAVSAGTAGSGSERGILQAVNALKCNGGTWLRQDSSLAVLIVSDEDNCSDGNDCKGEPQASASYLTDYLGSVRQLGVDARVYGIFWRAADTAAQCPTAYNQAVIYSAAVTQTNGTAGSICDGDFTPALQAISKNIAVTLKKQFSLQHIPVADTLKIYINDQLLASGYNVSGTVINLQNAPGAGAVIRVDYDYVSYASRKDFALSTAASPVGMQVFTDGTLVDPSGYTYDQTGHIVTFNELPAAAQIKIVYFENVVIPQDFAIKDEFVASTLKVKVDGKLLDSSAYVVNQEPQSLHLNTPPAPGATVEMVYDKILKPRLSYPVADALAHMQITEIDDQLSGAKVEFTANGDFVVFDEKDFEAGRPLVVHYSTDLGQTKIVNMNSNWVAGSPVTVKSARGVSCDVAKAITGTQVNLGQCSFSEIKSP